MYIYTLSAAFSQFCYNNHAFILRCYSPFKWGMMLVIKREQALPIKLSSAAYAEGQTPVKVKDVTPAHSFQISY